MCIFKNDFIVKHNDLSRTGIRAIKEKKLFILLLLLAVKGKGWFLYSTLPSPWDDSKQYEYLVAFSVGKKKETNIQKQIYSS